MFLYYTRGLMRWVGGVHCGDTGAMEAEGQARTTESPLLLCHMPAALCLGCRFAADGDPLLSACCDAAALLCLAPLPPANKRASVRRRC